MVLSETVGQRIRRLRKARQRQLGRKYRRKELAAAVGVVPAKGGIPLSPPTPRYSGYRGSAGRFPRPVPR